MPTPSLAHTRRRALAGGGAPPRLPTSRNARPGRSRSARPQRAARSGTRPHTRRGRPSGRRASRLDDRLARKRAPRRFSAEPGVDGRPDIRELAVLVDPPRRVPAVDVREQQSVLARMVRRRRRRIAAVVGGGGQQILLAERVEQVRQPPVEVLQAAVEVDRVVAVAPEHVCLDEVHEDEPLVDLAHQLLGLDNPVDVAIRRARLIYVLARKDVADLPDAMHLLAGLPHEGQVVRAPRLEREIVAVRCPFVVTRLADERPRDHAPDGVLAGQDLARDPAALVELLERDRLLVRRDLEDRVGRGVDDPLAGALMLLAELLDDLRPRRWLVAEDASPRAVHERVNHVVRTALRVGRKRRRRDHANPLPVAGRPALALRAFDQAAGHGRRALRMWAAIVRFDMY